MFKTEQTTNQNNNGETLCVPTGLLRLHFYLNLLYQLVMLGPKQPYHEKHSPKLPEKVGQQSAMDHGANRWGAQYGSVTSL